MKRPLFLTLLMLFSIFVFGQTTVTGIVNDESGSPIPGVTVVVKGTTTGTITNAEGNYSIGVENPDEAVLIFSFVGMTPQEIPLNGQSTLNTTMTVSVEFIEEVVAVGYGTIKKRDITGSVGSVGAESLVERGVTSAMEAIQGQMAGVQVTSNTGRIGGGFEINIRGVNTLGDNKSPLYVVDGVPTSNIDFLNPQDIDRIDILKDASSTAIYGSRGTNGVVIVTTKQGTSVKGTATISYDGYYGVKSAARLPQMMSGDKWWEYHKDAYVASASGSTPEAWMASYNSGLSGKNTNDLLFARAERGEYYDWYDLVLKNGTQQNHHVSISGQSKNGISYVFGVGYQAEEGLIDNESIDKYTIKGNINHQISEKWQAGTNINFTLSEQEMGSSIAMQEAFRLNPLLSPYDEDGELYPSPGKFYDKTGKQVTNKTSTYNPLLEIANSSDENRNYNVLGNFYLEFKPIQDLALKTTLSYGAFNIRRGRYWGALTNTGAGNENEPSAIIDKSESFNYTWDNQINYNKTIGDHDFNAMALYSIYNVRGESSSMNYKNLPFESGIYNAGAAGTINSIGSGFTKQSMISYVFRLNYSYKGKYLLTLSNRWDGSSKLSEGNKWNSFPSGAVAWRVSEEDFLSNSEVISNLKARVSYGYTGNNAVAEYQTQSYADKLVFYNFLGEKANGFALSSIANTLLTWEKTRELNIGVDFGLFNNRIYGSIDTYDKLSKELLMTQKLPNESGWASMIANVGSVSNKGIELALTGVIIDTKDFNWQASVTFTKNKNEIVEIYGGTDDDVGNSWFIGEPVQVIYNYKFDGIWQAGQKDEAASYGQTEGQAKVVDVNNDGKFTAEDDRMILGSPLPDWTGSLSTQLSWKNIDFAVSMYTNQGVLVNSGFHANFADVRDRGRQKLDIDSWYVPQNAATSPNGPKISNTYPQPRNAGTYWRDSQVGFIKDASFVKVKNISLGYTVNKSILNTVNIKSCRVYVNVLNPFVFTDYEGWDPEWADQTIANGGVGSTTYQLGVNLKF